MIKRVNQKGIMIPPDASNGHVWWVSNPIELGTETNLIKKDRPFLIINIEPSYNTYKVNGVMLQTRDEYALGRYEHVLDMSKSGRYSVIDCSNITTINLENLKNHIYQVDASHMRVISSIINSLFKDHCSIRAGQVWQYQNNDCVVYNVSTNNATNIQEVVTLLPISNKSLNDLILDDIVLYKSGKEDGLYDIVTVGNSIDVLVTDLIAYKYSISDITLGKIVEGYNKSRTINTIIENNPSLKSAMEALKSTKSNINQQNQTTKHSSVKKPNNQRKKNYKSRVKRPANK